MAAVPCRHVVVRCRRTTAIFFWKGEIAQWLLSKKKFLYINKTLFERKDIVTLWELYAGGCEHE